MSGLLVGLTGTAAAFQVTALSPTRLGIAPRTTTVTITFDGAVVPASITASSFRVFGKQSGVVPKRSRDSIVTQRERGKPRTRSAMMLRWISEVPAKMVPER